MSTGDGIMSDIFFSPPSLTLKLQAAFNFIKSKFPERVSRRELADAIDISYYAAKYRLDRLVDLGRLEVEKDVRWWGVYRTWVLAVLTYIHYTVVGTLDTSDEYTSLTASCTLDYDVMLDDKEEEIYYMDAVRMIDNWFTEMFNRHEIKFSSETSRTLKETSDALRKAKDKVTDIAYDWWWWRTRRSENKESDEGIITWEEPIPLGESGGWFTPGRV